MPLFVNFLNQGLVSIKEKPHQVIVQGVHELYDLEETPVRWKEDDERTNRLVLIGKRNMWISNVYGMNFTHWVLNTSSKLNQGENRGGSAGKLQGKRESSALLSQKMLLFLINHISVLLYEWLGPWVSHCSSIVWAYSLIKHQFSVLNIYCRVASLNVQPSFLVKCRNQPLPFVISGVEAAQLSLGRMFFVPY